MDRLQLQLAEAKAHSRDLKTQLADAADYKVTDALLATWFLQKQTEEKQDSKSPSSYLLTVNEHKFDFTVIVFCGYK